MQRTECSCASIEMVKGRVSSRITTDKINHGLEIRRGKSLGLFTRSSLIGPLMRAGFLITAMPILTSAQTRVQITAMQAQIAAQQAQKKADLAISQLDPLQTQLDAISQRDALQAQLEDTTFAAKQRDSLQNQPKAGEAAAAPAASAALATRDLTLPPEDAAALRQDGGAATPDKVQEGAVRTPQDEPSVAFTPAAPRPKERGRHGYRPRPPARPQPQPTFWQRLFGHKETKKAKPGKPQP